MCKVTWCKTPIKETAHWATVYCDIHQQYKKYARNASSRPWLMYKVEKILNGTLQCEHCNVDPQIQYPEIDIKILAGLFDVDHIDPSIKGTLKGEQPENYQLLCKNCHAIKSYIEGDFINKRFTTK